MTIKVKAVVAQWSPGSTDAIKTDIERLLQKDDPEELQHIMFTARADTLLALVQEHQPQLVILDNIVYEAEELTEKIRQMVPEVSVCLYSITPPEETACFDFVFHKRTPTQEVAQFLIDFLQGKLDTMPSL